MTRRELYVRTYAFLQWMEPRVRHPDLRGFLRGMELLNENVSADPEIRIVWDESYPEEIAPEDAFGVLQHFLDHWKAKCDLFVFEQVLYRFDPDDIDFHREVPKKWKELVGLA